MRSKGLGHKVGGVENDEEGERGRAQVAQGMTYPDFTLRTMVTCQQFSGERCFKNVSQATTWERMEKTGMSANRQVGGGAA